MNLEVHQPVVLLGKQFADTFVEERKVERRSGQAVAPHGNEQEGGLLDGILVDFQDQRLIVLLAQSLPDVARRFFVRLKIRLFEAAPQQAQAYLDTVSAIVVPNGESFQNAEDFLAVALEEE